MPTSARPTAPRTPSVSGAARPLPAVPPPSGGAAPPPRSTSSSTAWRSPPADPAVSSLCSRQEYELMQAGSSFGLLSPPNAVVGRRTNTPSVHGTLAKRHGCSPRSCWKGMAAKVLSFCGRAKVHQVGHRFGACAIKLRLLTFVVPQVIIPCLFLITGHRDIIRSPLPLAVSF